MAKKKSNNFINVFKIFFSSIHTYFLYLDQLCKFLLFPILGQIIPIILIFILSYFFTTNFDNLKDSCSFFENEKNLFTIFIIILVPLFIVLIKAIFDYIIAFSSLNILFYTNSNKKTAKKIDFSANNNVIKRKLFNYIILLFLVTILFIIPPFIFLAPIIGIFLSLSFQVFALEGDVSATKSIKRSIEMIKSNFIPTFILLLLCFAITYMFLPSLFIWTCEKISIYYFILNSSEKFANILPLENLISQINNFGVLSEPLKEFLSPMSIARYLTEGTLSYIIICFTLPFRCCCFTQLYKIYDSEKIKENSKETDEIVRRACTKKGKN